VIFFTQGGTLQMVNSPNQANFSLSGKSGAGTYLAQLALSPRKRREMRQKHIVLGRDKGEAEAERDKWLSEHPDIEILREHPARPEPSTLLVRIGGRNVPRISIEVEYEYRNAS
jgi:hypothetical protein